MNTPWPPPLAHPYGKTGRHRAAAGPVSWRWLTVAATTGVAVVAALATAAPANAPGSPPAPLTVQAAPAQAVPDQVPARPDVMVPLAPNLGVSVVMVAPVAAVRRLSPRPPVVPARAVGEAPAEVRDVPAAAHLPAPLAAPQEQSVPSPEHVRAAEGGHTPPTPETAPPVRPTHTEPPPTVEPGPTPTPEPTETNPPVTTCHPVTS